MLHPFLEKARAYDKLFTLKVPEYIVSWGKRTMDEKFQKLVSSKLTQMWEHISELKSQLIAELRGEKPFPQEKLNQIVLDVADVLAKHGQSLQYQEDYNALRMALAENYFTLWQGYDTFDCLGHVNWTELREKRQKSSVIGSIKKHLRWPGRA